jgi:hypothetical protein
VEKGAEVFRRGYVESFAVEKQADKDRKHEKKVKFNNMKSVSSVVLKMV